MPPDDDDNVVPLGMVHISLPFKSMDDVRFSGAYAPLADQLVDTLKEHLSRSQQDDEPANNDEVVMQQLKQGIPQ